MKIKHKFGLILFVLVFSVMTIMPLYAQVEEEMTGDVQTGKTSDGKRGGIMDTFLKVLGGAAQESLQESIEEFIGTYKGRIDEVKLLERRGNSVVLEVTYEGIKRKDGVFVEGEVLQWGDALKGFSSSLSPIQEKEGSVRLTIGWKGEDDSGWGLTSEAVTSDQIRLSLVRETNPERPFGSLVYDFPKEWTNKSDIEVPEEIMEAEAVESEDTIELAEGENTEETQPARPGITTVKPPVTLTRTGSVLKPVTATAQVVTEYNFFENANKAQWKNSTANLPFPGTISDSRGFARTLKEGIICPNNGARNLLQTHPQWVNAGTIAGWYPRMILGENVKFKAVGALLKGALSSDGVDMYVSVMENNRLIRVLRKHVTCSAYVPLEVDLASWAGKKIQIVLSVNTGKTSTQDWAVWVNPRLENK